MMWWGGETPASDAKRPTKKWRLRAVLLVEARSDSYAGVICGVLCKVSEPCECRPENRAEDKKPTGGVVMNECICGLWVPN